MATVIKFDWDAFDRAAEHLTVSSAFNVNSSSVDGWSAVLSGMNGMSSPPSTGGSDVTFEDFFYRDFVPDAAPNSAWSRAYRTLNDE